MSDKSKPATDDKPPRKRGRTRAPKADVRIAAIDIGSNSIRQTVADVSPDGTIRVVDEMKAAPRLGAGISKTGKLSTHSMAAALAALNRMSALAKQLGAKRRRVVATSAVREALNGPEWLALVRKEAGMRVSVLEGNEEARLSFLSALAHFDLKAGRAVVVDIGGGSLELALSADGLVERLISLPFGAIRMTEKYFSRGITPAAMEKLRRQVRKRLRAELSGRDWSGAQLIGSGGTFTNLGGIVLARHGVQTARTVHGTRVARVELEHIVDSLSALSPAERLAVPGLNAGRADIITAGLAVIAEVLAKFEAREITVSGYGIREGILLELARVTPKPADPGVARERSVKALAERSHFEEPHARHVQKLALALFDSLGARLGCAPEERQLLADAALLHDIGYHINYDKHHKHSYHLITHAELLGMTPVEQVLIANIARYHRGAEPKKSHNNFGPLSSASRARVTRLAALLRVADGFDRGHAGAVDDIRVRWLDRAIRLTAVPSPKAASIRLELWGASKKSKLLADYAGVPVEIVAPGGAIFTHEDDGTSAD
jgi:exopolyphosphatase/guanosine-5'-triphosphate,3'-diphosphate pyrophosphatase